MSKTSTTSAFDDPAGTWNRRFANPEFVFGTAPNRWLERHALGAAGWRPGQRVLSVADGEGRNSVWLAEQGLEVDAFDIAEAGVAKARQFAADRGVHVNYAVADIDALAWPEAVYDGVAAIFIQFATPPARARLFAGIVRCLRPGGTLVLQGYTPAQLKHGTGGPSRVEHLYTPVLLREAFAALDVLVLEDYEDDLAEGMGHHGRSALVGLVARKR